MIAPRVFALGLLSAAWLTACVDVAEPPPAPEPPLNLIVFMTDDQRADSLWAMPVLQERFEPASVRFDRAYATTPLCCPSRASLLSGGFWAHQSGVYTNSGEDGGAEAFDDSRSIAVHLQRAGYRTALVGKYLNGYDAEEIPPGWDRFEVVNPSPDWMSYGGVRGSSTPDAPGVAEPYTEAGYLGDHIGSTALELVRTRPEQPFFLWVSHYAPHFPAVPAPQDEGAFSDQTWRGGAFDEADVEDKPEYVRSQPALTDELVAEHDLVYQDTLASLLSVDRNLADLLDTLDTLGIADHTMVVFVSDNGFLWGEHRLYSKAVPYEESVRVPLLVLHPDAAPGTRDALVSMGPDLGATLYAAAGIARPTAGRSLLPLVLDATEAGRDEVLLEAWQTATAPDYAGLVTASHKYVEYVSGERELYDLRDDPGELENLATHADQGTVVAELEARLAPQKGLAVVTDRVSVTVDTPTELTLEAWGGTPPYSWAISDGALPAGVALTSGGRLEGSTSSPGTFVVGLEVKDSSTSPFNGRRQSQHPRLVVDVVPPGAGGPPAPPPPRLELGATDAIVTLRPLGGVGAWVLVSPDPEFDVAAQRRWAPAGPDGQAMVHFVDLPPARCWWARIEAVAGTTVRTCRD